MPSVAATACTARGRVATAKLRPEGERSEVRAAGAEAEVVTR